MITTLEIMSLLLNYVPLTLPENLTEKCKSMGMWEIAFTDSGPEIYDKGFQFSFFPELGNEAVLEVLTKESIILQAKCTFFFFSSIGTNAYHLINDMETILGSHYGAGKPLSLDEGRIKQILYADDATLSYIGKIEGKNKISVVFTVGNRILCDKVFKKP